MSFILIINYSVNQVKKLFLPKQLFIFAQSIQIEK